MPEGERDKHARGWRCYTRTRDDISCCLFLSFGILLAPLRGCVCLREAPSSLSLSHSLRVSGDGRLGEGENDRGSDVRT